MFAEVCPLSIAEGSRIAGHDLGQAQRALLAFVEIVAGLELGEMFDLVIVPAQPSCQDGMRGQSILAVIDLRGAHDDQLLKLGRHRAGLHDGAEMREQRAHDLWPVRHGACHIGNVAAFLLVVIENVRGLLVDGIAIEVGNASHRVIS